MSRTDVHAPITLAQLLHAEVVDESGRRLGRVHDVRVVRDSDPAEPHQAPGYRVESLIIGRRGVHVRLGLRAGRAPEPLPASEPVPWEDVVAFERGRLTVKGAGSAPDRST